MGTKNWFGMGMNSVLAEKHYDVNESVWVAGKPKNDLEENWSKYITRNPIINDKKKQLAHEGC